LSSSADTPRPRPKVAGHRSRVRAGASTARSVPVAAHHAHPAADRPNAVGRNVDRPTVDRLNAVGPNVDGPRTQAPPVSRRRWIVPVVALVASLAVLGTVGGLSLQDSGADARAQRAAANQARTSIEQMLSYNYKTIDGQAAQIEGLLTGSFKKEFSTAMAREIKPLAVKNQTVVQARVSDVGVMSSSPTTVRVMAFVNQARVGTDQKEPVVDQNRVLATLSKVGDRWLVSRVDAF
jgi:Mce-associated membrane protein